MKYFNPNTNEYFFNRHRPSFDSILYYYQSRGHLERPTNLPVEIFAKEIIFFQLGKDVYEQFRKKEGFIQEEKPLLPQHPVQKAMWCLFEYPETSVWAKILAVVSVVVILISITSFIVETWPTFRIKYENNIVLLDNPFFVVETACIVWFTIEFSVRFVCCPAKLSFFTSFLNLIDIVAIVPYYITVILWAIYKEDTQTSAASLAILRVFRLVRVFRVFKLSRHASGLQILGKTITSSLKELLMLLFFLSITIILFGASIYFAEYGSNEEFASIPHSFWWALITMTTVGYGDSYPVTGWGKLIGSFCAITGVLTIALPVPVIVSNFSYYYQREKENTPYSAYEISDEDMYEGSFIVSESL